MRSSLGRHRFDYLAAGMVHEMYFGFSWCRIGCRIDPPLMGSKDLSDGTWVWPEALPHYVREHRILLPEAFIQDALAKSTPVIPGWTEENGPWSQLNQDTDEVMRETDETYWQQWCSSRRTPQFLADLRARRLVAETLAIADSTADTNEKIAALVRKLGLRDATCVWKGCTQKALVGRYICAHHSIDKDDDPQHRLSQEFGKLLSELNAAAGLQPAQPPPRQSTGLISRNIARITQLLRRR